METGQGIEGVIIDELKKNSDNRGWLVELFRQDELKFKVKMSYLSLTYPGIARGPHEHRHQTDIFYFLGDFRVYLWDNRINSLTYRNKLVIENAAGKRVIVPPGVVHGYKNIGDSDGYVLNFPDRLYRGYGRKHDVDEIRYETNTESPFRME